MKNKYFKPIDPKKTKPANFKDLELFKNKLIKLSKKIHKEKFIKIKNCLICNSKKLKKIFSSRKFQWMECIKCGHHQKNSMPKYETLLKFYNDETVENYLNEININYRLKTLTIPKYNFIKKFISKNKKKRWLDLASGLGDMPYLLKKRGWHVISTEIYEPFIKFAKKKLKVNHTNLLLDQYLEYHQKNGLKKFSVVGALGYFDILPNPLEHAKMINKLLEKKGTIAVNIPINDSVSGFLTSTFPEDSLRQITPMDFSVFSKKSIFKMLNKSGFKIKGVWYHGLDYYELISKLIQKKEKKTSEKKVQDLLVFFNDFQKIIDKNKMSDLLLICATKIKEIRI